MKGSKVIMDIQHESPIKIRRNSKLTQDQGQTNMLSWATWPTPDSPTHLIHLILLFPLIHLILLVPLIHLILLAPLIHLICLNHIIT